MPKFFLFWTKNHYFLKTQVRIAEADNTTQYWPNLGSQESAILIGPVSLFALVKYWADDGGLCRLFKFTDLRPKLGPVSALHQADSHFYYEIEFRKYISQNPDHGWHITEPFVTFTTTNHSAYRSYHSSNGTILAADLRQIFGDAGPVLGRI